MDKIKFKDLSAPLKIAVVISYAIGSLYAGAFLVGFILAAAGV